MTWEAEFRQKLVSAEAAASIVKSGDRVVVGTATTYPQAFMRALAERAPEIDGVEVFHMRVLAPTDYARPGVDKHIRLKTCYLGDTTRQAEEEGKVDFFPSTYYGVSSLLKNDHLPVDMVVLCLSGPDTDGYFSYGTYVGYQKAAKECARTVVAEVNENMPWTCGTPPVHVSEIDRIIQVSYQLPRPAREPLQEIHQRIGRYAADLIEDGATLQIGIGAIPEAILRFLSGKKELGIHTEFMTGVMVPLIEQGMVTNQKKRLNQGKSVGSILDGSPELSVFAHRNRAIELFPIEYVNDPCVISQNDKAVAINSAIEVDLTGQVNCEAIGRRPYSGVGGSLDFALGANLSRGGKSIYAFASTARDGQVSRIVPVLSPGTPVTIPRTLVDYAITEYGVAQLRGKSLRQRAKMLIDLAAPPFREGLWNQALELGLA